MAENGAEAVEKFHHQHFDVILMDVQMPLLNGYEATSRIRGIEAQETRRRCYIIALTANALAEEASRSIDSGCDEHLTKPIRKQTLLAALSAGIAKVNPELTGEAPAALVAPR